jgi:hypothetical protein
VRYLGLQFLVAAILTALSNGRKCVAGERELLRGPEKDVATRTGDK